MRRRCPVSTLVLAGFIATLITNAVRAAEWEPVWEHWYVMELADSRIGWMHERMQTDGERYRSAATMEFAIARMGNTIEMKMDQEFIESMTGEPMRTTTHMQSSMQTIKTIWAFKPEHVEVTVSSGGREHVSQQARPETPWLAPMAAHRYWNERREADAKEISITMIDPQMGLAPFTTEYTYVGETEYEFEGRTLPATKWEARSEAIPGEVSHSIRSSDGHVLEDSFGWASGRIVVRLTTREQAMAIGNEPAPELMLQTFVAPEPRIERPRSARRIVMRVTTKQGDLPELPTAGAQRVEEGKTANQVILHVDVNDPLSASSDELKDPAYLESSAIVDSDDALIDALARKACRDASEDLMARAKAMRAYVASHISKKDLDTGFASASETARMRTGDCSEHGVLLCAMLRAQKIPARVATGLVYVDSIAGQQGVFGWHMWTQALIGGKWIDLDATLPVDYDAAHVLTGTSSLSTGEGFTSFLAILKLMGNMKIEVLDVSYE